MNAELSRAAKGSVRDQTISVPAQLVRFPSCMVNGASAKTRALHVPSNGDAVFKDEADNLAQILSTVGTGRQIQLIVRFTF